MGALVQNVRYGLRMLGRNPGFTAAAVLCLALGIGATTAIFSVVNAVLLRPLSYAQSGRLVRIFTEFPTFPNGGLRHFWVSAPEYLDLKRTELYLPYQQRPGPTRTVWLILRAAGDPTSALNAVRQEVRNLDRAIPIAGVRTLEDVMGVARSRPRFLTLLLTLFSSLALALAALGIYGVISSSVAQRTGEIGIRMALGAGTGHVLRLAVAGTVAGAIGAFALTRFLSGLLFGVSSMDALTFAAMAAALIAVTLLACYIPARRASKVDPLVALRYE